MTNSPESPSIRTTMLDSFFSYLSRTSPFLLFVHLIWIIVTAVALSASYIVSFHFTSVLSVYQEAHSIKTFGPNLRLNAKKDAEVVQRLSTLLESTGASRAYVFRYHNGLAAVSGVPFFFQTMTHEVISPGTTRVMQFEQRIPASMNIAINNRFSDNKCAAIENADIDKDSQNFWYFQSRGARSLIRCPIFMPNGDLFGLVGIDFNTNVETSSLTLVESRVRDAAGSLVNIFLAK